MGVLGGDTASLSGMGLLWRDFVQEIMNRISGGAERQTWAHHVGEKLRGCFGIRDYGSIMLFGSKSQRQRRWGEKTS